MRFNYGRHDWKTMERGQENCFLLTNGLGGFSSLTMIGSNARNDHALLMAAVKAPNERMHLVTNVEEVLQKAGQKYVLSSQEYENAGNDRGGFRYLNAFSFDTVPKWNFQAGGIEVVKQIVMKYGENKVALKYRVTNHSDQDARFSLRPYFQFVRKGEMLEKHQKIFFKENLVESMGISLNFATNGTVMPYETDYTELFYYSYDECDGRNANGLAAHNHTIQFEIPKEQVTECWIIYALEDICETVDEMLEEAVKRSRELEERAGLRGETAKQLVRSADQFIAGRASTNGKTILAGYPFFEDWGRDTMIALTGCCISTKRFDDAKSILRTFMAYCEKGLMPNLFPEGGKEPMYNTVDAALLFIGAVYEYYRVSGDEAFVKEAYPVMEDIVKWYQKGTDFGIHMDEDGLIMAGQGLDQVTWMDVRVGEILPTPRHGKPVEINAYWYNSLCVMELFAEKLGKDGSFYRELTKLVKKSFCEKFWNEEAGCLKDVLSGTKADSQIRCNQIWAVSQSFTMLSPEKERQVVRTVYEKLYTPCGLRSLAPEDEEFHPVYGGEQLERDLAYHQGTVWGFPLGGYYIAYLKVNGYSRESIDTVKEQLEAMEGILREGCIGQIAEIYDGAYPTRSQGCFAQAWSVGEILRVCEEVERYDTKGMEADI